MLVVGAGADLTAQPRASGPKARNDSAAPAPRAFQAPEPPDGRWLIDGQGREYFGVDVPLAGHRYQWVDDTHTRIRLAHGVEMDVVSYTDRDARVKVYRVAAAVPAPRAEASSEERERSAATYRPEAAPGAGLELQAFSAGLPQRGQWRNGFDVTDVNGDGHLDIVFGAPRKSARRAPTIFLGDGAGRWKPLAGARFPALPLDYGDAKVADLNGDGIPDLVLAVHLQGIVAMVGDGRGGFTAWSRGIEFGPPVAGNEPAFSSRTLAIVDWNRDGRPDILALGEGPSPGGRKAPGAPIAFQAGSRGATVYLNQGDGSWTRLGDRDGRNFGSALAVGDFDRDGRVDFAAGSDRWGFTALLNLAQPDGTWKETPLTALRREGIHRAVASGDFDGDGRPDLVVGFLTREHGTYRTGIDALLNRATGWERRALGAVESRATIHRLATGDLDGDGHTDVVGVDGQGALWVFRGDGKGGFTREPVPDLRPGERCQGYGLRLVDLDRDGSDEIVVSFAEERGSQQLGSTSPGVLCPSEGALQAWKVIRKNVAVR